MIRGFEMGRIKARDDMRSREVIPGEIEYFDQALHHLIELLSKSLEDNLRIFMPLVRAYPHLEEAC